MPRRLCVVLLTADTKKDQSPLERKFPSTAELAKDLKLLDPLTNRIRLYGSLENSEVTAIFFQA